MHYTEIFEAEDLHDMIEEGYVRVGFHPDLPFEIFCYTEKTAWERKWNKVTRACRGLIVNDETGEVVARPFEKFFNIGEPSCPELPWSGRVVDVKDKMDGSLGIVYNTPDGPAVATKGSFTSPQAVHATELLRTKYAGFSAPEGSTVLVEIVYPENRIVLNYGDRDELVYLATIDIESWSDRHFSMWFDYPHPFPEAKSLWYGIFRDAPLGDRYNSEGVVIRDTVTNTRYKMKQDNYINLHRLVSGMSEVSVWESIQKEKSCLDDLLMDIPEEFHDWATKAWNRLDYQFKDHLSLVDENWDYFVMMNLVCDKEDRVGRKRFAEEIKDFPNWLKGCLWHRFDGRNFDYIIYKEIRPKAVRFSEQKAA